MSCSLVCVCVYFICWMWSVNVFTVGEKGRVCGNTEHIHLGHVTLALYHVTQENHKLYSVKCEDYKLRCLHFIVALLHVITSHHPPTHPLYCLSVKACPTSCMLCPFMLLVYVSSADLLVQKFRIFGFQLDDYTCKIMF